jgi:hypothetical protein
MVAIKTINVHTANPRSVNSGSVMGCARFRKGRGAALADGDGQARKADARGQLMIGASALPMRCICASVIMPPRIFWKR